MYKEKWITYLDGKMNVSLFKKEFCLVAFVKEAFLKITSPGFYYPILNYSDLSNCLFKPV